QQNQFRAFALAKQYNAVQGTAKILRTKTGSKSFLPADKILCVEDLYVLLCQLKGVNPKRAYVNLFNQVLTETDFDFEPHTLCIYHNRRQSKFCALGLARKAWYSFK
uniref:Uncharacterized protein n=1 Tax=Romanomermis culicivorax TaxID=13658 RepID=A0A915IAF3_ROMCU